MGKTSPIETRDYFRIAAGRKRPSDGGPELLAEIKNKDLKIALTNGNPTIPAKLHKSVVRKPADTIPTEGIVPIESVRTQITTVYKDQRRDFFNLVRAFSIISLWEFGMLIAGNSLLENVLTTDGSPVKDSVRIPALMITAICAFIIGRYHGKRHTRPIAIYDTASIYHQIEPDLVEKLVPEDL